MMIRGLNAPISLWVDGVTSVTRVTFNVESVLLSALASHL